MTRAQTSKVESFDFYAEKTLCLAELTKLVRDHGLDGQVLHKDRLGDLLKSFNAHFQKKPDLSELSFELFENFLV